MGDSFATKDDVKQTETTLQGEIGRVETSLQGEIGRVELSLRSEIGRVETSLQGKIDNVEIKLMDRIERVETTLLTEFHKYAQSSERRMLVTEVTTHTLTDRMAALETRVRELERKN
jgi:hypothetical protein